MKNGCIFALAFAQKTECWEKGTRERQYIDKDETRDSVCLWGRREAMVRGHEESKVKYKAILTMKSLILAQDER